MAQSSRLKAQGLKFKRYLYPLQLSALSFQLYSFVFLGERIEDQTRGHGQEADEK